MSESLHSIQLKGRSVAYRIRSSAKSRRISLRVTGDGLRVGLPRGVSPGKAIRLIEEHADWVLKELARQEERQREARLSVDGDPAILLRGEPVAVRRAPALKRVMLDGDGLVIQRGLKDPASALEAWLRAECKEALNAPIARAEALTGRRQTGITIRGQKSRWGSCSPRGTLSFNWRLIMAPPDVLDYVACHEVVHLGIANHSPAFWRAVDAICPHVKPSRQWLKDNQHRLMLPLDSLFAG